MSAKHGWMRSTRLLGCLLAVALVGSALLASSASAMKELKPTAYVALGDSLSFGYKAKTFNENQVKNAANCEAAVKAAEKEEFELAFAEKALCEPAASFEPGFVGYFGGKLAKTEKKAGNELTTINLGCPGETSGGLIGALSGKEEGTEYLPCLYHNFLPPEGYPLKTEFGHTTSQLEELIKLVGEKDVKAVSLQIGSNDELHVLGKCESAPYREAHGFASILACAEHEAGPEGFAYEGGLINHILTDIGMTVEIIRKPVEEGGAGYAGKIEILGFFNPFGTLLFGSDKLVEVLNSDLAALVSGDPNIKVVPTIQLVNPSAALYKEGESAKEHSKLIKKEAKAICKYTEMCDEAGNVLPNGDVHPTALGYKKMGKLMAAAF